MSGSIRENIPINSPPPQINMVSALLNPNECCSWYVEWPRQSFGIWTKHNWFIRMLADIGEVVSFWQWCGLGPPIDVQSQFLSRCRATVLPSRRESPFDNPIYHGSADFNIFHEHKRSLNRYKIGTTNFIGSLHEPDLLIDAPHGANRYDDADDTSESQESSTNQRNSISCGTWWEAHDPYSPLIFCAFDCGAILVGCVLGGVFLCYGRRRWLGYVFIGLGVLLCGIRSFLAGWGRAWGTYQQDKYSNIQTYSHNIKSVSQKFVFQIRTLPQIAARSIWLLVLSEVACPDV